MTLLFGRHSSYLDVKITGDIFVSREIVEGGDGIDDRRAQWATELPDLDTFAMDTIGRMRWITLQLRPTIEGIFERHGLDAGEFDVIATLRRSGPPYRLRPTELFKWLMISSGGLTARLVKLEKAGLIVRAAVPDDGRSILVQLTESGRSLAEAAFREDMAFENQLLAALDRSEADTLARLLRKLARAVPS